MSINLSEEVRNDYVISSKMKKVWSIQLELLDKILQVCQKYNLRIWVEGGTLLGTIREHGYIPWDDDIDLIMFRDDYNKLLEVAPKEIKSPYFFQNAYTDKKYYYGHSQLRKDGTSAILPYNIQNSFHLGIFIDIFVMDQMPKDKSYLIRAFFRGEVLRKILIYSSMSYDGQSPKRCILILIAKLYTSLFGYVKTYKMMEKVYSGYECPLCNEYSLPIVYPAVSFLIRRNKEWYEKTIYMPFEDMQVPVPSGYDDILKQQYGEYMKPVKAPSSHGDYLVLDPERSYTEYLPELRKKLKTKMEGFL